MNLNIQLQSLRIIVTIFMILNGFSKGTAQENNLFIPVEIQKAYKNGTRSYDGKPGDNFWQNTADYNIDVKIDPSEKMIIG